MSAPSLTVSQTLNISFSVLQAVLSTSLAAVTAPFRSSNTPRTLHRHLILTLCRGILGKLSTQQLQAIAGTTESNYEAWAKSNGHPVQKFSVLTVDNTKAFWIGDPEAENVVIFCESSQHCGTVPRRLLKKSKDHGGGWAMPASGHFTFAGWLVERARTEGKSISCLFLQYDLAPGHQYPRQLTQAVELFRYTIDVLHKSPSQIMFLGDSSGGNLILAILSHCMHPHPEIKPLTLSTPLKAAIASSPVCILNTRNPLFVSQERQDPGGRATVDKWMIDYLGSRKEDPWTSPLNNNPSWWSKMDKVVKEVLIGVASVEMMAGDTLKCCEQIKTSYKGLIVFVSEVDFHAEPSIGPSLGLSEGETSKMMIQWALERF